MNTIKFFEEVSKLQDIKRSGWVERIVKDPQTSADHSFMVTFECLILGSDRKDIDLNRAIKMALVHDIAESQVGDIITHEAWEEGGEMPEKKKYTLEKKALQKLLSKIDPKLRKDIMTLWLEFEERKTKEAVFVNSVDKFETIIQAVFYHKQKRSKKDMACFWTENDLAKVKDPKIKKLLLEYIEKI